MSLRTVALFSLVAAGPLGWPPAVAQQIENGDFEAGATGTWELGDDGSPVEVVPAPGGSGRALLLESAGPGASFSQLFELAPDSATVYELSFRIKTELGDSSRAHVWANQLAAPGQRVAGAQGGPLTGESDWRTYRHDIVVTPRTRAVRVGGSLAGAGRAWFDDFAFRPVELDTADVTLAPAAAAYVAAVVDTLRTHAVHRGTLDFGAVLATVRYLARGAESPADTYAAIQAALALLDDNNHSRLYTPDRLRAMLGGMDLREVLAKESAGESPYLTEPALDLDSLRAAIRFGRSRLLSGPVGYVSLPGFTHGHHAAHTLFVDSTQAMIRDLDAVPGLRGWVLDLRGNHGGATPAMVSSAGPLLGPGNRADYVDAGGQTESSFSYRDGAYVEADGARGDSAEVFRSSLDYRAGRRDLPIAVLVGGQTGSAAEGLLALLMGEPGVRVFGTPTAGFTTGNRMVALSDGAGLNVAGSYLATRDGRVLTGPIAPDVVVREDPDADTDATLAAALAWLLE